MGLYILQKKVRLDERGNKHINFNVTLPPDAVSDMGLDNPCRTDRAVDVFYDQASKTVTIKKI